MIRALPARSRARHGRSVAMSVGAGLLSVASLAVGAAAPAAQASESSTAAPVTTTGVPSVPPAIAVGAPTPEPSDLPGTPTVVPTTPDVTPESCLGGCPPVNDIFADATTVSGYTGTSYGTNAGASSQPYEPILSGGAHETVWYAWEAPSSGDVTFDLCLEASGFDSLLAAYTGSAVNELVEVASNDDSCGSSSEITFAAVGGTTYSVQVDSYIDAPDSPKERVEGVTGGTFYLHWNLPEPELTLSVADLSAVEGDGKTTYFEFEVTLSAAAEEDVSFSWATSDGTAVAPDDYTAASGTVDIEAGDLFTTFTVDVNGDLDHEADETFNVSLSEPVGAGLDDSTAIGTIENDDLASDLTLYYDTYGGRAKAGGYINYIAQVYNLAGSDGASVVINMDVPENTTFAGAGASAGSCSTEVPVVCSVGVLGPGASAYVYMSVIPNRTGVFRSSAAASSDLPDPDPSDNVESTRKTVTPDNEGCTMVGTSGPDAIVGTNGDDVICVYGSDDTVNGRDGNDTIRAGLGNDVILGGPGFDVLLGDSGEDTITGGADQDVIDGGGGYDTASYATSPAGATVAIWAGFASDDGFPVVPRVAGGGETLTSVGALIGSDYADDLGGDRKHNDLYGGGGDDELTGLGGQDTLDGGDGTDTLDGGGGTDACTGETVAHCES